MSIYGNLGGPCVPHSISIPSNTKFIPPLYPGYFQKYTNMYKYPGSSSEFVTIRSDVMDGHPIQIKNFFGKIGIESTRSLDLLNTVYPANEKSHLFYQKNPYSGCTNC